MSMSLHGSVVVEGLSPRRRGNLELGLARATAWYLGLSPRRRGNPDGEERAHAPFMGSIPAQAGEPYAGVTVAGIEGVYPRAGGGTALSSSAFLPCEGSIPAQAGEPDSRTCAGRSSRVYPRAGGGT